MNWVFTFFFLLLPTVAIARYLLLIRHYIQTGDFGDPDDSFSVNFMDGEIIDALRYYFVGVHPGMILMDAVLVGLVSSMAFIAAALVVAAYVAFAIYLVPATIFIVAGGLYAIWARKRVVAKEEFTSKLKGEV